MLIIKMYVGKIKLRLENVLGDHWCIVILLITNYAWFRQKMENSWNIETYD